MDTFYVVVSRHSALVWRLSACPPPAPPDSRESPTGDGLHATLSQAPHTLSQGHQELSRGCAHARSWSHHGAGWSLSPGSLIKVWMEECIVPLKCLLLWKPASCKLGLQAFRKTMALSHRGDVDEAVLFAKVTDMSGPDLTHLLSELCLSRIFFSSLTLKIGPVVPTSWLIHLW